MAEFPAMPLFTDAYLADTTHLGEAEHGRYLLMLMHMWRAPNQRFPNDDSWLARKFKQTVEWVTEKLRPLICEFCQCDGNWITQRRLIREWNYVKKQSRRQSDAAKSRWDKKKNLSHGNTPNGIAPTPTPTPTLKEKKETRASDALFPRFWERYPNKVGKPKARVSFDGALKRTSFDEIMAGLDRYIGSKPLDRPWCNPTTFLNQDRWADQPANVELINGHRDRNGIQPYIPVISQSETPDGPPPKISPERLRELGLDPESYH